MNATTTTLRPHAFVTSRKENPDLFEEIYAEICLGSTRHYVMGDCIYMSPDYTMPSAYSQDENNGIMPYTPLSALRGLIVVLCVIAMITALIIGFHAMFMSHRYEWVLYSFVAAAVMFILITKLLDLEIL